MNILIDTNVILDVMLDRPPFAESAGKLLSMAEQGEISALICATTVTTIHYLATKALGKERAKKHVKNLTALFDIAPVNRTVIGDALESGFSDFEDAVVYQSACHAGAESIVTRDPKGFKKSDLPVYTPEEILKILEAIG